MHDHSEWRSTELGAKAGILAIRHPASLSPCSTVPNVEVSNLQTTIHHRPSRVLEIAESKNIRLTNVKGPETQM